ncbi:23S rRNA pseudouridine1911/1915/1917 synthase [Caldalkalibacillus uzonensis]|uniref:Pseudouridine synthase n=1 Tax=Caldalkalibacillus uzonensis TaxID=353224 RepID=A0ABU0CS56_9BACI|nr:RluA family pseudouridine synthase [Caldalkalibacillus uzonensis]MDQ0339249.1 23S rRNA pseudouridine1911/1915/1917 synthase [Caldalkalibacillus uzonensis]
MSQAHIFDWQYEEADGIRIDKFLAEESEGWSRSQIQSWIKEGRVTVNGQPVKVNYKLTENDHVVLRVPPPQEVDIKPEPMDLDIVYEDEDVLVVNKPRGLVVHPAPGHYSGTLVNGLLAHCTDLSGINGVLRPGIVHRIDKDTSGLLMVAKNDRAHLSLAKQLSGHRVIRKYVALVHGQVGPGSGTINAPIGRDPHNRQRMAVVAGGKPAVTHFEVIQRFTRYSLIECRLETGRTHQIRVHMKYIGHPLAGDPVYGPAKTLPIDGQALHAKVLGFEHPSSGEQMIFDSPLPQDMEQLINSLD